MKKLTTLIFFLATVVLGQQSQSTLTLTTNAPNGVSTINVSNVGQPGHTNHCYWVVSVYPSGMVASSNTVCNPNSADTLNSSNYNIVSWSKANGPVIGYWVIRIGTPNFPGSGINAVNSTVLSATTLALNDQSNTKNSFTYNSVGTATGHITIDNSLYTQPIFVNDLPFNEVNYTQLPPANLAKGLLYLVVDSSSATTCSGGGGVGTPALCFSTGTAWISLATSVSGGLTTMQTNGVNNTTQNPTNFINSAAFNGLSLLMSNPIAGNVQPVFSGTLGNGGLTNSSITINSIPCTLGSSCSISGGLADPGSNGILFRYSLNTTRIATSSDVIGLFTSCSGTQYLGADGACHSAGSGSGTVTNFSAGNLSPLFTTSVAAATSTPVLSFSLSNFGADNIYGNFTGGSAPPSTQTIPACPNDGIHALTYSGHTLTCTSLTTGGSGGAQWANGTFSSTNSFTITHNLNSQPVQIVLIDSSNCQLGSTTPECASAANVTGISYPTVNTAHITLSASISGKWTAVGPPSAGGGLLWSTLTNAQWTALTNTQWSTMGN